MPFSEYKYDYTRLEAALELLKLKATRKRMHGLHALLDDEDVDDILTTAGMYEKELEVIDVKAL